MSNHDARHALVDSCADAFARAMSTFIPHQLGVALGEEHSAAFAPGGGPLGPWTAEEIVDHLDRRWFPVYQGGRLERTGVNREDIKRLRSRVRGWNRRAHDTVEDAEVPELREMLRTMYFLLQALDSPDAPAVLDAVNSIRKRSSAATAVKAPQLLVAKSAPPPRRPAAAMSDDMEIDTTLSQPPTAPPPPPTPLNVLVVVDGSNVAWRHGHNSHYSHSGILLVHRYYTSRGCRVVIFLPDSRLSRASAAARAATADSAALEELLALRDAGKSVVGVPAGDYDDSYLVAYARKRGGVIVSNDRFEDHLVQAQADGETARAVLEDFLVHCRIPFGFLGDEFLPDPNVRLVEAGEHAQRHAAFG